MQIAEDYSHCEFLIRLPGYCPSTLLHYIPLALSFCLPSTVVSMHTHTYIYISGAGSQLIDFLSHGSWIAVPAFRDVIDVPLVVRRLHKSREEVWNRKNCLNPSTIELTQFYVSYNFLLSWLFQVRRELGIGDDVKLVILNFGGQVSYWPVTLLPYVCHLFIIFLPSYSNGRKKHWMACVENMVMFTVSSEPRWLHALVNLTISGGLLVFICCLCLLLRSLVF